MSFVLSVVCLNSTGEPRISDGTLLIQEAVQDAGAAERAGYVVGLSKFFDSPVEGRSYYVQIPRGDQYPSSRVFFHYPENDPDDTKPIVVYLGDDYRVPFDMFLRSLLAVSRVQRVLVVAEWNGDVTTTKTSRDEILEDIAAGDVYLYGPWSIEEFWTHHDQHLLFYPSVTIIQAISLVQDPALPTL